MHNIPALMEKMKGNWATISPEDAASLGLEDGQQVSVLSQTGLLTIKVQISLSVNINFLHDDQVCDYFSGLPVFNGTPCRIKPIE